MVDSDGIHRSFRVMNLSLATGPMARGLARVAGTAGGSACVALASIVLLPTFAMAADDAAHGGGAKPANATQGVIATLDQGVVVGVTALAIFAVVFLMLAVLVWPKILKGLSDRENKIRDEIESAERARRQAKEALEEYQNSLAQARAEAAKMLENTRAQQTALAADLKAKADVELAQMRERATKDIETAKRAAITEIYNQGTEFASALAGKILRREINPNDHRGLMEDSLAQLNAKRN
jgi:F-type H+-transporting ATPase subunit b